MATPVGWMLGGGCLLSCSAIFGIDESHRRDESEPAGAGGADPSTGGRPTGGRSTGGRSTGGTAMGGGAGNGGNGGGGAAGHQAGTAGQTPGGAGGEAGSEDRGAILGEPCTGEETRTACTSGSPHLVLECKDGVWQEGAMCAAYQACIPESGDFPAVCESISAPCWGSDGYSGTNVYTNFCDGENRLIDCESFRPASYTRYCPFGCQDGACLPGTGEQLIVHTGRGAGASTRPRTIPVCVDANEDDGYLVAWIRDEVERTWARTADYTFEGWGACDTLPEEGVVLSFESECRGHLVNDIDPTSKLVRLEICRSFYLEGRDELRPVDEPLARFLGRHHFGHVIGIPDNNYSGEPRTAMMRGIDLLRITEYEISPGELNWASEYCALGCRKHPGALVTTRGRCLEVVDGSVVARACADHEPGPQVFTLKGTKLVTADPEQCVVVSGDGEEAEVRVGECTAEQFALTGAALHSLGRCVTPASLPATPETALFIGACDAVPESWMGWSFDVTASTENGLLASIRHDGLCASIPGGADELNLVPVLRTCEEGSGEQIFELRHNGEIGFGDLCVAWGMHDGSVYLSSDCGRGYSVWTVTGALTTPSGLALTLPGDNATAKAIKAAPSQARTFDFYF